MADSEQRRRAPSGGRTRTADGWPDLEPAFEDDVERPWAWVEREQDETERVDVSALRVTAVLVCFDAARWLPATLAGCWPMLRFEVRPTYDEAS